MEIDSLSKIAELITQLDEDQYKLLLDMLSSKNIAETIKLCKVFLEKDNTIPAEMTIGDRTYAIIRPLNEGGEEVFIREVLNTVLIKSTEGMNANLGKNDAEYLLHHQNEIPCSIIRDEMTFIFPEWRLGNISSILACLYWNGQCFTNDWICANGKRWNSTMLVLHRK